jgi:hypothetical protein
VIAKSSGVDLDDVHVMEGAHEFFLEAVEVGEDAFDVFDDTRWPVALKTSKSRSPTTRSARVAIPAVKARSKKFVLGPSRRDREGGSAGAARPNNALRIT